MGHDHFNAWLTDLSSYPWSYTSTMTVAYASVGLGEYEASSSINQRCHGQIGQDTLANISHVGGWSSIHFHRAKSVPYVGQSWASHAAGTGSHW